MSRAFDTLEQAEAFAARSGDRVGMELVVRHEYGNAGYSSPWNEKGRVVVLRFEHPTERRDNGKPKKSLTQVHRGDDGKWRLGLPKRDTKKADTLRPLYRLGELIAARERGESVALVLEGESAVDEAWSRGVPATCPLGGSGAVKLADWTPIATDGWLVGIAGSADSVGQKYEADVTSILADHGAQPRLLHLPGLHPDSGEDFVEYAAQRDREHRSNEEIRAEIVALVENAEPSKCSERSEGKGGKKKQKTLAELAVSRCNLFHDREKKGYAAFIVDEHVETWSVQSRPFRLWLGGLAFESGVSGSRHSLEEAVEEIAARAAYGSPQREVHRRWAWQDGKLYYDLADDAWRVVEASVDAGGVARTRIVPAADCPVAFVRSVGATPQVEPVGGGSIDELRSIVNVTDDSWPMLVGFLLGAFLPSGELPALEVTGEENSGKTWLCEVVLDLTDPSRAGPCAPPREIRDLYVRARQRRVLAIDNVSSISQELSDALCRLTTGTGAEERAYFTNDELATFEAHVALMLNGIGRSVTQSDLASRTFPVETVPIDRSQQLEREVLRTRWQEMRPRVFGAVLRAAVLAHARRHEIKLDEKPRLADVARWVEAAAPESGLAPGSFVRSALAQRDESARDIVEDSPFGRAVRQLAESKGTWSGTASELLDDVRTRVPEDQRDDRWPKLPRAVTSALKRLARPLRDVGVGIEYEERANHARGGRRLHLRSGKVAAERAGRAERAAAPGEQGRRNGTAADAPQTSRDMPARADAPPVNGASGAFGASDRPVATR